ncbi:MAG: acyl-ACP--UDP-N-acetylglucosamine O-acyltransferase [Planctomycetes bacterium]|nr:acyl-ACP--UDP-N-acetylglucosamine O-acyltransferase [Planctomycetota bacterium]
MKPQIHPTAIIEGNVNLSDDVVVGPYCILRKNVTVGEGTVFRSHVVVEGNVKIGKENVFYPFCSIGLEPQDIKYKNEDTSVEIGDSNTFREYVTVNRGTIQDRKKTVVGDECLLMACSHIAHDSLLGNNVILANCVLLAGHVVIEDNVYISGQVCIHQFVSIGKHAFISGDTRVPWDAPPFMITQGPNPDVVCVNTVGLRRNKFQNTAIDQLKQAHKIIYTSKLPISEAIELVERKNGKLYEETNYLLNFIKRSSRGFNGRARDKGKVIASNENLVKSA